MPIPQISVRHWRHCGRARPPPLDGANAERLTGLPERPRLAFLASMRILSEAVEVVRGYHHSALITYARLAERHQVSRLGTLEGGEGACSRRRNSPG